MDETAIFRVNVGGEIRAFDPWMIERKMAAALGESIGSVIRTANMTEANEQHAACRAEERLLGAARLAFGLGEVKADGSGFTEKTVKRVLSHFLLWQVELKKNTASPAILSAATARAS